jgi:diguanylate cyclase (GGDEF)-like protein
MAAPWSRLLAYLRHDDDALAQYRPRIASTLSALSAVLLVPFTVNHLLNERIGLALAITLAQGVLIVNTVALRRGQDAPVPFWLMTTALIGAVLAATVVQGAPGTYWAFPTLYICYFVLSRRVALVQSGLFVAAISAAATWQLGLPLGVRVLATLALTLVMINVVLNVIGELQRQLLAQAITDPLTGAFNRRHLESHLERLVGVARPGEAPGPEHAMLAIDIDHFKRINDRFGHAAGNDVLRRIVAVVQARLRRGDLLFRTGGEEFVLLLPATPHTDALRVAEELRRLVEEACVLPGERVTVSIGVGTRRTRQGADEWLKRADGALYEAKRKGRNRVSAAFA